MEQLGLYPLSVILSFLTEGEATRLLITKRRFAKGILPLFRLRGGPNKQQQQQQQFPYKFVVSPVQEATVLLERLNTRRLFRRRRRVLSHYTTWELARLEWTATTANITKNQQRFNGGNNNHKRHMRGSSQQQQKLPPTLELLRFCKHPFPNNHNHLNSLTTNLNNDDENNVWKNGITLLASYPRSGNTLVRTLLERITGLVTGSDTRPDRTLSRALSLQYGLVGEGVTNSTMVRVVKTHWPERRGCAHVKAQRVILLVRNPYDVIDSYWNMNATNTHNQTVTDDVYEQFQDVFQGLVRNEMKMWKSFLEYWCSPLFTTTTTTTRGGGGGSTILSTANNNNHSSSKSSNSSNNNRRVPLLLVRFEDLILQPAVQMERIMQFLLQKPLSEFWLQRIHQVTCGPLANLGSYQPRSASVTTGSGNEHESSQYQNGGEIRHDAAAAAAAAASSIGKSLRKQRYSDDLLQYMHSIAAAAGSKNSLGQAGDNFMQLLGYDIYQQNFPKNFSESLLLLPLASSSSLPPLPPIDTTFSTTTTLGGDDRHQSTTTIRPSVTINQGAEIRPPACPYGRAMRQWRWQHTNQDKIPFPTVDRNNNKPAP